MTWNGTAIATESRVRTAKANSSHQTAWDQYS